MKNYDFIFVVLTYKNYNDLEDFFHNLNIKQSSKVIVVDSFYNNETKQIISELAYKNNADYISVPNNGYGAGNNKGCEHAIRNYDFKYIVISNPDVNIINYLKVEKLPQNCIIAPKILTLNNKNQNPYSIYCSGVLDKIKFWCYNRNNRFFITIYYAFIRISRELFLLYTRIIRKNCFKVKAAHGAHCIISRTALHRLMPLYNEKMFLFHEEEHLAKLAELNRIPIYYIPQLLVLHKEDGSINTSSINTKQHMKDSFLEYYNYWYK